MFEIKKLLNTDYNLGVKLEYLVESDYKYKITGTEQDIDYFSKTNQQINSIIPKDGFSSYFIYLLMQTLYDTINKLGQSGSTIVNLNKTQFGKIQVIIPTVSVMTNFDEIMSPIFEKILQNQKENLSLVLLRDTLMPKLISGEIDVSEINI